MLLTIPVINPPNCTIPVIPVINPPNCTILDNWIFENFILADELFAKVLRIFKTCVSVKNIIYVGNYFHH